MIPLDDVSRWAKLTVRRKGQRTTLLRAGGDGLAHDLTFPTDYWNPDGTADSSDWDAVEIDGRIYVYAQRVLEKLVVRSEYIEEHGAVSLFFEGGNFGFKVFVNRQKSPTGCPEQVGSPQRSSAPVAWRACTPDGKRTAAPGLVTHWLVKRRESTNDEAYEVVDGPAISRGFSRILIRDQATGWVLGMPQFREETRHLKAFAWHPKGCKLALAFHYADSPEGNRTCLLTYDLRVQLASKGFFKKDGACETPAFVHEIRFLDDVGNGSSIWLSSDSSTSGRDWPDEVQVPFKFHARATCNAPSFTCRDL